ncbi:MAG: HU family DNA-binding protein [Bacteroidota bacterium]|nr:HU family DNA-binding protein [Bacteroidota bacterium]
MSLKLKKVNKRNPRLPEDAPKFYASAMHGRKIALDELASSVSERCSLRRSDVHGVLIALMDIIPDELGRGSIVNLGKLGSFYVSVKSEGTDTAEEQTPAMVSGMKIQYRPTKELRKQLRMIDVSYAN